MSERDDYEALFLAHLPFIDRAAAAVARVLGLRGDDAEEFASWTRERLWEDDYRVLRKWRGDSRLTTYLTTVIATLGREFRVRQWGRWRPSAAAHREGPLAVRLETLIYRDGLRLDEAGELLRTRGETDASDGDLARLLARLPTRARPRRDDGEAPLERLPAASEADERVASAEDTSARDFAYRTLYAAIAGLEPLEQTVIRMHFLEGRSIADVARALETLQKPLYRVKDQALRALGRALEGAGVSWERVGPLLGGALPLADAEPPPSEAGDSAAPWLSNDSCDPVLRRAPGASAESDRPGRSEP